MTLGQKLKRLRTDKNLTQKALADHLHVTFQTVSKWENDENEPDIATLKELAKLYECSLDFLLSEEEIPENVEEGEEVVEDSLPSEEGGVENQNNQTEDNTPQVIVEENKKEVLPIPVVEQQTIIIKHEVVHTCDRCKKDIFADEEIIIEDVPHRRGRSGTYYTKAYFHKKCHDELEHERAVKKEMDRIEHAKKGKRRCFGWGIFGGLVALGISLAVMLTVGSASISIPLAIVFSILIGYGIFADLYCILSGSYIGDLFVSVAGWSVKFPGIIFTWDLEGLAFLVVMKILFAVLGFFISAFVLFFAISLSAALAVVSFPFILVHNIRTDYADSF